MQLKTDFILLMQMNNLHEIEPYDDDDRKISRDDDYNIE